MTELLGLLAAAALACAFVARRAAARAGASERRLRGFVAHSPDLAMLLVDRDHRIVIGAGLALERNGRPAAGLVGRVIDEAIAPERAQGLRPYLTAAFEGRRGSLEWAHTESDQIFSIDVLPYEEGGEVTHVVLALRDLGTERVLRRSLERQTGFLSAVLAELGDRVTVADADGRLLGFGGARLTDVDLHPLEWAEHFGLHHRDGTPLGPHEAPLLRALRGEQVRDAEVHAASADGRRVRLESGGPVVGSDGRLLGAVVVNADLTAFRDAEDRLRRSEERHRRVVESMTDCVFETDRQGRWAYLTDPWTVATGHSVEESLGHPSWEFVHPDDRAAQARAFAPLLSGAHADVRISHRFLTATGGERWAEVQARAISGWDGLPTGFVGVMRDVTDAQRAHQYLLAEQAVVRALVAAGSLDDAGPQLAEALGRELGWSGAELWRMAGDERLCRVAAWTAPGVPLDRFIAAGATLAYEVGDGFAGQAWMSRVPLWQDGSPGDSGRLREAEAAADGIRSSVALPLRADGVPVAVMVLVSRTPREPEPGLVDLIEALGAQITQFLRRREAEGRAAEQARDLKTLSRVAHELAVQTDMYAARTALCRAVRDVTRSSSATLWEPASDGDGDGAELEATASFGVAVRGLTVPLGRSDSLTVNAFRTGEPRYVADVAGVPGLERWHEVANAASAAWVPVLRDGRCVGVLAVGWSSPRAALPEREEELLRLLAAEAAITIQRTDLLAQLQSTARTDALTGLPNRRVWDEDIERELSRARRHGGSLCLAMIDLDRFKAFNDRHGHQAGDRLLAATAAAWRPWLRATDTLARYGGEEFGLLLPHSDEDGALGVVERLLGDVPLGQTASAGIAVWDGAESADRLLARADAALYAAKSSGRARATLAASA